MGLIRESKKVDLLIKSEPWSEKELKEFRKIMKAQNASDHYDGQKLNQSSAGSSQPSLPPRSGKFI